MRHRKSGIKLNRTSSHRTAMFRNMVTSLFKYDRIRTTDAKAKELRRWADNLITLAKRGDLHARRQALSIIREKNVVHKLFENADERYGQRAGGYTRIIKLGKRPGDAADVSMIELITSEAAEEKKKKSKKIKSDKKQTVESKTDVEESQEKEADLETEETTAEASDVSEPKAEEATDSDAPDKEDTKKED